MSDDAAIRGFMEKVDAFFISGGNRDEVPQSDGNIIRLCKREHLRSTGSEDKKKASLRYAYALALSPKYEDVEVGINLLEVHYVKKGWEVGWYLRLSWDDMSDALS
ncbi:hypothetical protein HA466_0314500 [Hirschfeldia incana]|nr:hypothetical protein HA466_0314500 [Hirschfeldia incana]